MRLEQGSSGCEVRAGGQHEGNQAGAIATGHAPHQHDMLGDGDVHIFHNAQITKEHGTGGGLCRARQMAKHPRRDIRPAGPALGDDASLRTQQGDTAGLRQRASHIAHDGIGGGSTCECERT